MAAKRGRTKPIGEWSLTAGARAARDARIATVRHLQGAPIAWLWHMTKVQRSFQGPGRQCRRSASRDDYVDLLDAWDQESKRPYVTITDSFYGQIDGFPDTPVLVPECQPYAPAAVVADLTAAAATSSWECTKLLALVDELNDSYASGKTYASYALLRATLDYVPPLLRCADFAAVANNYA